MTSVSTDGWATAGVLIPLPISIFLTGVFFYWETLIPADEAVMYVIPSLTRVRELIISRNRPPRTWFYKNFSVLFGAALLPFFWWNSVFIVFTTLWQDVFHWTAVSTVVHM